MLTRLMYLARKLIAKYWMAPAVPTGKQWISYVNSLLPRERLTYSRRREKGKFDSIWQSWLGDVDLAPHQLVVERLQM